MRIKSGARSCLAAPLSRYHFEIYRVARKAERVTGVLRCSLVLMLGLRASALTRFGNKSGRELAASRIESGQLDFG
jgi:hypothetical protein